MTGKTVLSNPPLPIVAGAEVKQQVQTKYSQAANKDTCRAIAPV